MKTVNLLLVSALLVLGIMFTIEKCADKGSKVTELINFNNALNDSLRFYKNKDSQNVATISVLETGKVKDFTNLNIKDEEIKKLQATIKDYSGKLKAGSSVTRAGVETIVKNTNPTIVAKTDTTPTDKPKYFVISPTYMDSIENKWISYKATMNMDSATLLLKVRNDFNVIVGRIKGKPFVDLVTENPYSEVRSLRTYQVSMPKEKRFGIGPNISASLGSDLKPIFTVGVGIQYNLIRF